MTLAIYPNAVRGLMWPVMKTHVFSTVVQKGTNETEVRILQYMNPIWHWTLSYEYLKDNPRDVIAAFSPYTDYRFLEGFLLSNQGQFQNFLLDDLYDDSFGANPLPGGTATAPSVFHTSNYPGWQFAYPTGSYILDNNAVPHLQLVIQGGISGSTVPAFSTSGGTTTSGTMIVQDQGVFGGANAQLLQTVADTTNPITAAIVGSSGGSGFALGDYLSVSGGSGTGGILAVAGVTSLGVITSFSIVAGGSGYVTTTNAALLVLSGSGIGSPTANITATTVNYSPIQRYFGGQFYEDVTDLNLTAYPLTVWDAGVLKTAGIDYTVQGPGLTFPGASFEGMYLQWAAAPTTPVTALGQFYFRVRCESDQQDIEQFMQQLWTIGGEKSRNGAGYLKLMTARVPGV